MKHSDSETLKALKDKAETDPDEGHRRPAGLGVQSAVRSSNVTRLP